MVVGAAVACETHSGASPRRPNNIRTNLKVTKMNFLATEPILLMKKLRPHTRTRRGQKLM